jgi:hypothetical protein
MPRGGKRPGAGAPKGNLNALKHGERSRQFARLGALLAASPAARQVLLRLADRDEAEQRNADDLAQYILAQVIQRGLKRGRERLIVLPPIDERRTIVQTSLAHEENKENTPPNNQKPVLSREGPDTKQHDHSDIS